MTRIVKRRRQRRAEKIRRRKRIITVMLMLTAVMLLPQMVNFAFANKAADEVVTVIVSAGDSIWSIARDNSPKDSDIRRLVQEIIAVNAIENCEIYAGQELIIPID